MGNNKNFKGFIVAKSFVQLDTEGYELQQEDGSYLKDGKTYYKQTDYGFDMFIDEWGNVQYQKDAAGNYIEIQPTIDATSQFDLDPSLTLEEDEEYNEKYSYLLNKKFYDKSKFNLASSTYDSFYLVRFGRYIHLNGPGSFDNLFTTDMMLGETDLETLMSKLQAGDLKESPDELQTLINLLREMGLTTDDLNDMIDGEVTPEEFYELRAKIYLRQSSENSTFVR